MGTDMEKIRERIRVFGIVQGVGFRPFVDRIAHQAGVRGSVCNRGPYVEIFSEGSLSRREKFRDLLVNAAPERSMILKTEVREVPWMGEPDFRIIPSRKVKGDIFVSPDLAICPDCKKELYDPKDHRYLHPFINCTACGPRLTILDSMPYDRVRTSMGEFPMCDYCEKEYTDPATRRYHAQPVCCPDCGPRLTLLAPDGHELAAGDRDSIISARQILRDGGILAIKGIGGFHLACDACNPASVERLRKLKARPFKPFAVMVRDLETAERECQPADGFTPALKRILDGPEKPITILPRRAGGRIAEAATPDNPKIGIMLPYTPLHLLLFDYPDGEGMTDCFIMTSANPKGAPICRTDGDVRENLGGMFDAVLTHNRKIRLRSDDSVMFWHHDGPYMIRRSRGYAPLPVMVSKFAVSGSEDATDASAGAGRTVLGMGGELKNTFTIARNDLFYASPYVGDLSDVRTVDALRASITRIEGLLEMEPELIVCDKHPLYHSSEAGREIGLEAGIPVLEIQHHYAHVLSCMAENDIDEPVFGVCFDGTGYGDDGTIWGGEFFLADRRHYRRIGSLGTFDQAGGDLASKEGWRIAAGILGPDLAGRLGLASDRELKILAAQIRNRVNCVTSSSAGRLFDGASAVLGFRRVNSCEGEAAMVLQFAAESWKGGPCGEHAEIRELDEPDGRIFDLPMEGFLRELAEAKLAGTDTRRLAYRFHEYLADAVLEGCRTGRERFGDHPVVLTGGVMQNTLLLDLTEKKLREDGFTVYLHKLVPANDGGIGAGQALFGMEKLIEGED